MKIVLARVLSRVTLRLDARHTVRVVRRGITFAPSGGVRVIRAVDRAAAETMPDRDRRQNGPDRQPV